VSPINFYHYHRFFYIQRMKKFPFLFFFLLSSTFLLQAQTPKEGSWKGTILYSNAEVPFTFELIYQEDSRSAGPVLTFVNGDDRAPLQAEVRNDSLIVPMFAFDITLKMAMGDEHMEGQLTKHYSGRSYPFQAEFGKPRYEIAEEESPVQLGERWKMTINPGLRGEYPAVGLFSQNGNHLTGTIMTETSDYRFFEGRVMGLSIEMSVFDGVHSFLLRGTYDEGAGQWSGELILDDGYARPWIAQQDENAELPDPFGIVDLSGQNIRPNLEALAALDHQKVSASDYENKVLIVQLMGTWCTNSKDQTRYLTQWLDEHDYPDLEILAVNYEANYSPEYGLERIEAYKEHFGIPYKMILGGPMSKRGAAEPFSFMDQILAFPTLMFIDKDGYARYVHSYFNGPATGEYYRDFDRKFNALVKELTKD
jgi:thiol-disulfide isomerase/thioredoxin